MLKRKLIFYRWTSMDGQRPVDIHTTMDTLHARIHSIDEFEILDAGEYKTAVLPTTPNTPSAPVRLRVLSLRGGTQLPARWSPDSPLESIDLLSHEYSVDVTHVLIWPDGVAAQELHRDAPRLGRLSGFLRTKLDTRIAFEGLYNPNMHERLEEIRGNIRTVHISLTKPEQWDQHVRHGAFGTLLPAIAGVKTPSLKVSIGMGRYGPRDHFLSADIQDAALQIAEEARDQVDSMIIGGLSTRTGRVERINLLNERLHLQVELPPENNVPSVPAADAAFGALATARSTLDSDNLIADAIRAQAVQ